MNCKTLSKLMEEAAACGFPEPRVRDVGFAILRRVLKSAEVAYAVAFPDGADDPAAFAASPLQKALDKRVAALLAPKKEAPAPVPLPQPRTDDDITADENKAEIVRSIRRLEDMIADAGQSLTPKERVNVEAQLLRARTILKEKFEVSASAEEQLIVVAPKFNHVCEQTGRECWLQTKEYAMKHWNLIEKPKKQ